MTDNSFPPEQGDLLVVEDNPTDVRFIEEAFVAVSEELAIHIVHTVPDALDYVHARGEFADAPVPDVMFLDWHLTKETGAVVLEAAKSIDPAISVVVMTGSARHMELVEESVPEADVCIEKPTNPEVYVETLRSLSSAT